MICPNCKKQITDNADFCPFCGNKINRKETFTEQLRKSTFFSSFSKFFSRLKSFLVQYKKGIGIVFSLLFLFCIGFVLFQNFYDFTKLSWDEKSKSLAITQERTVSLQVIALDKEERNIDEITFQVEKGEIESFGTSVIWHLPEEEGVYQITAIAPSGKKITKKITAVTLEESNPLAGVISEKESDDIDEDGLTNEEEDKLGTDKYAKDSDMDGLSDFYEIHVSKTDPLKADSDGDGVFDVDELDLGLDPLKADSFGDGKKDGNRNLNFELEEKGISLSVTGKGNIASTTIDVFKNSAFSSIDGVLEQVYNFSTKGNLEKANVVIPYDLEEVERHGFDENDLSLFYFHEDTKEFELVKTNVDTEAKVLTATLDHFSKYFVGAKKILQKNIKTNLLFVIDNSVSMFTESQLANAGYESVRGAVGNDTDFKRISLTNHLIDLFSGNYYFGVAEFSGNYVNRKKFDKEKEAVKEAVMDMKSNWKTNFSGTHIISALKSGIGEFPEASETNYLILLTDGKNTSGSLSGSKKSILDLAKEKNVKVCVIGLGSDIEEKDLSDIASGSGCKYYNATNANALDEIYSLVGADLNYNYVDTDQDHSTDGMILYDSGFIVNRDGFSFSNYGDNLSPNGHCYGMALFAQNYFTKTLPMKLGEKDLFKLSFALSGLNLKSSGYDLMNTYFSTYQDLYKSRITDPALSLILYDNPEDYRDRVENDTWMIKKEYYEALEKIGATFIEKEYKGNDPGKNFSKFQSAIFHSDAEAFLKEVSKEEVSLIQAIWRLFILQAKDEGISFSSESDKAFETLVDKLSQGIPQLISINGNHAINAIRFIQDTEDADKFKIEVYDNNFPGESRYITVTRSKFNKVQLNYTAWTNEYEYEFTYDHDNDGVDEKATVAIRLVEAE